MVVNIDIVRSHTVFTVSKARRDRAVNAKPSRPSVLSGVNSSIGNEERPRRRESLGQGWSPNPSRHADI